jgi:hypothetical protein
MVCVRRLDAPMRRSNVTPARSPLRSAMLARSAGSQTVRVSRWKGSMSHASNAVGRSS